MVNGPIVEIVLLGIKKNMADSSPSTPMLGSPRGLLASLGADLLPPPAPLPQVAIQEMEIEDTYASKLPTTWRIAHQKLGETCRYKLGLPKAPPRPKAAFHFFSAAVTEAVRAELFELREAKPHRTVSKVISERWKVTKSSSNTPPPPPPPPSVPSR